MASYAAGGDEIDSLVPDDASYQLHSAEKFFMSVASEDIPAIHPDTKVAESCCHTAPLSP